MSLMDFILKVLSRLNPATFVISWLESRPWRLLVFAIPVVLAIVTIFALRASTHDSSGDILLRHYLSAAGEAMKAGDEKGAELRFRRADLIAPTDPRPRFGFATLAEKQGDLVKATRLMEQLASEPGEVGIHANNWLIVRTPKKDLDLNGRKLLIERLERAVAGDPANVDARINLASIYGQAGFSDKAIEHLRVAAVTRPVLRIPLIQMLIAAGQKENARTAALEAEDLFRDNLAKQPADLDSRLLCSSALVYQDKHQEAIQLLEQGLALSDPVILRKSISLTFSDWASKIRSDKGDPREVLERTSAALRADPSNVASLAMLMDLARDAETETDAVTMLEQRLAAGESPWLIHMILGTRLLEKGKPDEGAAHLEQAVKLNPGAAIAINNLAWTLATKEPVDLKRAEELAGQAVTLAPSNPQIRETRGQIFLKQGRWKDALADLEAVLPFYMRERPLEKQLPMLHNSLATAYENLGNAEMARRHRDLSVAKAKPAAPKM